MRSGGIISPNDPWALKDGRLNAPVGGSPQLPDILNPSSTINKTGYNLVTRPPWHVAGVDYYVGIDRGKYPYNGLLKDPTLGGLPTGATFAGSTVTVASASPVVLDGWDFSVSGGLGVFLRNAANGGGGNLTITNCFFKQGINNQFPINTDNNIEGALTIRYCEIDGNGTFINANFTNAQASDILIWTHTNNLVTLEYCYLHDAYTDGLRIDPNGGGKSTPIMRYNLCVENGFNTASHADWMQVNTDTTSFCTNALVTYNTYVKNGNGLNNGESGCRFNTSINYGVFANCTSIVYSAAQLNRTILCQQASSDSPLQIINPIIRENYCIPDTVHGHAWDAITVGTYAGDVVGLVVTGNINLLDGTTLVQ